MPGFDGNGNYIRSFNWTNDAANSIDITASSVDTEDNGFAAGLSLCLTRDNQGKMAADFLPSVSNIYNLGNASFCWAQIASGAFRATANALQGLGPVAGTFLDVTPDKGTFNASISGFAVTQTPSCRWVRVGNLAMLTISGFSATSNSTQMLLNNLPAAIQPAGNVGGPLGNEILEDNGAGVTDSYWQIPIGSPNQIIFFKGGQQTGFTNGGQKGIIPNAITLPYPLA
jgi:hypothetical protein